MKLSEFVQQTIEEIVTGVENANETIKEKGAEVATGRMDMSSSTGKVARDSISNETIHFVVFDVSVLAENEEGGSGGTGIIVGPIALGAKIKNQQKDSSVNKIRFSIPLLLPNKERKANYYPSARIS